VSGLIQATARKLVFLRIATGLGDRVTAAVIAVSLILVMEAYQTLTVRRLATQ
jgi:hypothetical protein